MLTRWFSESQSPDAVRVHRTTWNDEGWTWFKKSQSPDAVRVHRTRDSLLRHRRAGGVSIT